MRSMCACVCACMCVHARVSSQPFGYFLLNGLLIKISIDGFLPDNRGREVYGFYVDHTKTVPQDRASRNLRCFAQVRRGQVVSPCTV